MSKALKSAAVLVLVAAVLFPAASYAQQPSDAELRAQIAALLAQIRELQAQLAAQQSGSWCFAFNKNLRIEDSGYDVAALREALRRENLTGPLGTGDEFDETLASAVSDFQMKYKDDILTPAGLMYGSGYVGRLTRAKLNQLYGCGTPRKPRVLLDLSRNFLFIYDKHFGFNLEGSDVTENITHSLSVDLVKQYDAVIVLNSYSDVPFLDSEISVLEKYVSGGGGLFIVHGDSPAAASVMNRLARVFALEFGNSVTGPFVLKPSNDIAEQTTPFSIKDAVAVESPDDSVVPIITGANGKAVVVAKRYGQGRVIAAGDYEFLHTGANTQIVSKMLNWLYANKVAGNQAVSPPSYTGCDQRVSVGGTPSSTRGVPISAEICVSDVLRQYNPEAINLLVEKVPEVMRIERDLMGYGFPHSAVSIDMVTSGGSSWIFDQDKDTVHVVVPSVRDPLIDTLGVFAHENLNNWSFPGPIQQPLGEGMTMMWNSEEVFVRLGGKYAARGEELRQWHLNNFWAGDPTGTKFDIVNDYSKNSGVAFGKAHWIYDQLRAKLGDDFFRNYWKTIQDPANKIGAGGGLTINEFIYWMSVANKKNLFPFFKEIGTTVDPSRFPALTYEEVHM